MLLVERKCWGALETIETELKGRLQVLRSQGEIIGGTAFGAAHFL